jgi:hypothetical protein
MWPRPATPATGRSKATATPTWVVPLARLRSHRASPRVGAVSPRALAERARYAHGRRLARRRRKRHQPNIANHSRLPKAARRLARILKNGNSYSYRLERFGLLGASRCPRDPAAPGARSGKAHKRPKADAKPSNPTRVSHLLATARKAGVSGRNRLSDIPNRPRRFNKIERQSGQIRASERHRQGRQAQFGPADPRQNRRRKGPVF